MDNKRDRYKILKKLKSNTHNIMTRFWDSLLDKKIISENNSNLAYIKHFIR